MTVSAPCGPESPKSRWRIRFAALAALASTALVLCTAAAMAQAATVAPACDLYASTSGSDSNSGSASTPLRTVKALVGHLQAGQTGCLQAGQTFNENLTIRGGESHGAEGAPVTIASANPEEPALIDGRVVTETGADWLTFTHLRFTYSEYTLPSITVGSKHTTWTWDDVTAPTTTCFNLINSSYGLAEWTLIEHDRIHGCGSAEKFVCNQNTTYCETPPNDGFFIHGVYVGGGKQTTVRNDYIYENADRGVQMRAGAEYVTVEHDILDANGEGAIFGDGATHATLRWNIITASHSPCGEIAGCYDYGASEYNAVAPNVMADNDAYGNQCAFSPPLCYPNQGNIETMSAVSVEHNLEANPLYVDQGAHNYTLQPSSPVLGYGPDTAQPSESSATTESTSSSTSSGSTSSSTETTTTSSSSSTETTTTSGGSTTESSGSTTTKTKKGRGGKATIASLRPSAPVTTVRRHRSAHHRKHRRRHRRHRKHRRHTAAHKRSR